MSDIQYRDVLSHTGVRSKKIVRKVLILFGKAVCKDVTEISDLKDFGL